jgi:hypothetical protein
VPLSNDEIRRLNEAFNEVAARCEAELQAAEDDRRQALMALPAACQVLETFERTIAQADAAASHARAEADAQRMDADAKAGQARAEADNAAYAAFLANHAETIRYEAKREADQECDRRLREVGLRVPPVSGTELDSERKSAFRQRDAAHRAADDKCEESLRNARDTLGAANQAAYLKYMDAADAAAKHHEQCRAGIDLALADAVAAANEAFGRAVVAIPEALAIERAYAHARRVIEQRAETQKQEIYRRLQGD